MHPYFIEPPRLHPNGPAPRSVAERFWEKVAPSGECWLWTGPRDARGYGHLHVGSMVDGTRRHEKAHRVSWVLHYGAIPAGLEVCHNCPGHDNPSCVRPEHLFLGTHRDNMTDAAAKGVMGPREHSPGVRLTHADVRDIRRRYAAGDCSQRQLAIEFGIGQEHISLIVNRKIWKRVE